tara:strand:+ start:2556 stop:3785 length:1230 start_codon:yes stop_codon:yes gene_type:complete
VSNVFQTLKDRGFVKQCTDEAKLSEILDEERLTFYAGFDPTADSLHCGSLVPIMAMAHLQKAGHKAIALLGGGTTMVGDPSGKTELRKMMSLEQIRENAEGISKQLSRYIDVEGENGVMLNNADWLLSLNYVEFLREIGRHFRVNEMLRAESYRARLEREEGLSFIEFNYQLLQAYDFLRLFREQGCTLQIGGDDQWGNILAGTDLIRRKEQGEGFGLTFPLLTTARGEKMGKTAKGAVWLDAGRTSPYEFFQYWRNCDDRDVRRFLAYFTFLPMDEVDKLGSLEGAKINEAKEILAFEVTKLLHGEDQAREAQSGFQKAKEGADATAVPSSTYAAAKLEAGIPVLDLFAETGLAKSKGEARRLVQQGGAYINGESVGSIELVVTTEHVQDGAILLRFGKKKFHRVVLE